MPLLLLIFTVIAVFLSLRAFDKRRGNLIYRGNLPLDGRYAVRIVVPVVPLLRRLRFGVVITGCRSEIAITIAYPDFRPHFRHTAIIYTRKVPTIERLMADTRYAVGNYDTRQVVTPIERPLADTRYSVRYRNARQPATSIERMFADTRHAVRNRDTRQTATITKRLIADTRYAVGNYQLTRQAATTLERNITDTRYAVGNYDTRQAATAKERPLADIRYPVGNI